MTDKLEALKASSRGIARLLGDIASFDSWDIDGDIVDIRFEDENGCDTGADVSITETADKASQAIGELLAALEEKDQQVKELEEFAKLALDKIPNEKVSPDFYIVGNGPCFLAYPESMGPEARGDLAGNLRKAYLSPTHWKERAKAAEQREEHLKATVDVLSAKNAELERANAAQDDHINQQQDRIDTLEKKNGELGKYAGELEQRLQPLNFQTSAEEFLAHCLKAEEISGDKQQTRIKELIGWFSRYYQHAANPKWLSGHVAELCYFIIKNAQAEQRLQQPIKLTQRYETAGYCIDEHYCKEADDGDYLDRDELIASLREQGYQVEGE